MLESSTSGINRAVSLPKRAGLDSVLYPMDRPKSTTSKEITRMKIHRCLLQCLKVKIANFSNTATEELHRPCIHVETLEGFSTIL